jgi:uncharacterized protein YhfF
MLFKPHLIEKILMGEKTQTRRIRKPGERLVKTAMIDELAVFDQNERLKWRTGGIYAICPGRGKPGLARIRVLDIRKEGVMEISEEDARAEGVEPLHLPTGEALYKPVFAALWNEINRSKPFGDNPEVWVLTFEKVD